ncbi:MAG TPA: DUF296 domain-containing protein [Oscillatoriaceae cyanobacterium]
MQVKLIAEGAEKTYALVLMPGEDPHEEILTFARERGITAGRLMGVGAFARVTLAYFNLETRRYEEHPYEQQVEVTSFLGNLALTGEQELKLHAHVTIADREGRSWGGHFLHARVQPTLELFLIQSPHALTRRKDDATGLDLLRF